MVNRLEWYLLKYVVNLLLRIVTMITVRPSGEKRKKRSMN